MKALKYITITLLVALCFSCMPPQPEKKSSLVEKHNYIVLLDLSDRLIIQEDQPSRDKEIIKSLYSHFETRVRNNLYVRSRDEIKVVIAPQRGSGLQTEIFEEQMYINIDKIPVVVRRKLEDERRSSFMGTLDTLYQEAVFSKNPKEYYGADIWKYFYEDLKTDYSKDTLTKNFLIILTDGYPIVGKDMAKLQPLKESYPDLKIAIVEAAPRDKDLEWDRVQELWQNWFNEIGIANYTFIKRKAISKEMDEIKALLGS